MSTLDYSQEPEKIWKASLIKHQNEAYFSLFYASDYPRAWELLRGWIGCLGAKSQQDLKDLIAELEDAIFNKKHLKPIRTYQIFDKISTHVYDFYLTQQGFGVVQTSALPCTTEAPKVDAKRREKAGL